MKNWGDPSTGVCSAIVMAKGQPRPPSPPPHPLAFRDAVPGFPLLIHTLLPHLSVCVTVSSLRSLLLHLQAPVTVSRLRSLLPQIPLIVSVSLLRSLLPHPAVPALGSAYPTPWLHPGSPVFASPLRLPGRHVGRSVVPHEPLVARSEAQREVPEANVPQLEAFRPGHLRLDIAASCLSRRSSE
jgi:hypothetical protein